MRLLWQQLKQARELFFSLDRDNSGSIDVDELMFMMRSQGQDPSKEDVLKLIASVDDDSKDGQIQMREFFQLYANGLSKKGNASEMDAKNIFK